MKKSKLVHGVGINDADYQVHPRVDGIKVICPFYKTWKSMISRCYCHKYQERNPSYIGCSVSDEWLTFSKFKLWMETKNWKGNQLDKDILISGNKIYSEESCVFVDRLTNNLINTHNKNTGLPLGVTKKRKRYRARCQYDGDYVYLGLFDTPEDASNAYLKYKSTAVLECGLRQEDERVKNALIIRSEVMAIGINW